MYDLLMIPDTSADNIDDDPRYKLRTLRAWALLILATSVRCINVWQNGVLHHSWGVAEPNYNLDTWFSSMG